MYKEENIFDGRKKVAVVYRGTPHKNGSHFPTPHSSFLQVGFHKPGVKKNNQPHKHGKISLTKDIPVFEILIIKKGKLKITFYNNKNEPITEKILKKDDSVLIMEVAHSVSFYKKTEIMEIKQGPYRDK